MAFVRRHPAILSWMLGAVVSVALLIGGNAGVIPSAVLEAAFALGIVVASLLHIGSHDLSAIAVASFVNSIAFGAAIYGIGTLLNVRRDPDSDKRS